MKLSRSLKIAAAAAAVTLFAAQPAFAGVPISGAGSSFAAPLISACKVAFQASTGNTVNYGSGGSGLGRTSADGGINEFNFSDASYTPKISTVLHIPVIAAPVAIAYNATSGQASPTVAQPQIYLSQQTLSDIFTGKVTKWNDPEIKADNAGTKTTIVFKKDSKGAVVKVKGKPVVLKTVAGTSGVALPDAVINVIVRSDSSGTTQNLANFFIAQFPSVWTKASSGTFASVFPGASLPLSFSNASGSSGVAALAARTPYSITYVESSYSDSVGLGSAGIKNASGKYQLPTAGGTASFLSAATASATGVLTFNYGTTEPGAYVLGIVSYALVNSAKTDNYAKATTAFLKYLLSDACVNTNPSLQYSTISGTLLATDNALIAKLAQ